MPTHRLILFITTLICLTPAIQAAEFEQLTQHSNSDTTESTNHSLPLGSLYDNQGNQIDLPQQPQSSFEFQSDETTFYQASDTSQSNTKKQQKRSTKKPRKPSRKQLLASRSSIADDASCRWLNSRLSFLERKIQSKSNTQFGHHQEELAIRQQEWICLKCGAEGPATYDHGNCQHKR